MAIRAGEHMGTVLYRDAREFFNAAREAAREVRSIRRQIERMEMAAEGIGGGTHTARVRSTPTHDRMAREVAARVDVTAKLERRAEELEGLIDAACAVLYGSDQVSDGLYKLCTPWWVDALYHYYIGLRSWQQVAYMLDYSKRQVMRGASAALDVADAVGFSHALAGAGVAE